jgi:hypothetical protein
MTSDSIYAAALRIDRNSRARLAYIESTAILGDHKNAPFSSVGLPDDLGRFHYDLRGEW